MPCSRSRKAEADMPTTLHSPLDPRVLFHAVVPRTGLFSCPSRTEVPVSLLIVCLRLLAAPRFPPAFLLVLLSWKAAMGEFLLNQNLLILETLCQGGAQSLLKGSPDWFYLNITRWSYLKINWHRTLITAAKSFQSNTLISCVWITGKRCRYTKGGNLGGCLWIPSTITDEWAECSTNITTTPPPPSLEALPLAGGLPFQESKQGWEGNYPFISVYLYRVIFNW